MEHKKIDKTYGNTVKQGYKGTKSGIQVGQNLSGELLANKSCKYYAPHLLKICLDAALHKWQRQCGSMGLNIRQKNIFSSISS